MFDLMFSGIDSDKSQLINILGGISFFVLVLITIYVIWVYAKKIKTETSEGELAEETWDGIGEYKHPLPTGWAGIYAALVIWNFWYWFAYDPINSFSQVGQWNEEVQDYKAQFESQWQDVDKETLSGMGESVFLSQCAQCHGLQADGNSGQAADLTKRISADAVEYVITHGSNGKLVENGMMPDRNGLFNTATNAPISDAEIKTVASYVANGLKGAGKDIFEATCSSCHADGKGIPFAGANIAGWNASELTAVIKNGKQGPIGHMPAFKKSGVLSEIQYKAVTEYIMTLQ